MSEDVRRILRDAYDRRVNDRDARPPPAWETEERDAFLMLLQREQKHTLLELGAAWFFFFSSLCLSDLGHRALPTGATG